MPPPHITTGERRGLIVLLLLQITITGLLYWRDHAHGHMAGDLSQSVDTNPAALMDTLLGGRSQPSDTALIPARRKHSSGKSRQENTRPLPLRSPRDERID